MNEPVTREQAMRLKKVGFDLPVSTYYQDSNNERRGFRGSRVNNFNNIVIYENCYSVPTIHEALMWAMEKFGLYGYVVYYTFKEVPDENSRWFYYIDDLSTKIDLLFDFKYFQTYQLAHSDCLDAVLTEIERRVNDGK